MYIPDYSSLMESKYSLDYSVLLNMFIHSSDVTLVMECQLIGEIYRAIDEYSGPDDSDTPCFLEFIDDYVRCLFPVVVQRFVELVLADSNILPDGEKGEASPA